MPVTTTSAAIHITPVVLKTFFNHLSNKGRKLKDGDETVTATDDVFFDEAFHIVKSFIELGTHNTIESLQAFTNTHVPAPYWAAVSPVMVPLSSCNKAADLLIDWFEPEELENIVGGKKWWQVRGLDGLDGEWVTEKEYLKDVPLPTDKKLSTEEVNILRMEHLETVMLYIHGGAYFWGSINTHRYQIIRYARKIKGRAFAVNYRKAPQYPWPCPLQDVLAAYFYLVDPPPGSLHKPVPPTKIVLAGDSAGGGLCITALTVLRDMGVELPAGAVLISPWVDLTHSFPSVMHNTPTDIIPPHGFIHKPSPIWPLHVQPKNEHARVIPTKTNAPPQPGHADTLNPSKERLADQVDERTEASAQEDRSVHTGDLQDKDVQSQAEMMEKDDDERPLSNGSPSTSQTITEDDPNYDDAISLWEPKPPKVLMNDPEEKPLELRSQIQIYAMNEQLTHPLVSPVLQGSLGNLCPLYIIAGDGEVLRDEIIYLAHKAAHPQDYPTRKGVFREGKRQKENVERFTKPTKVHLQVFDGMCHVLTVFTFTDSAKYAYRSIAEFVKHVTTHSAEHIERNPFPEFHIPPAEISDPSEQEQHASKRSKGGSHRQSSKFGSLFKRHSQIAPPPIDSQVIRSDVNLYRENEEKVKQETGQPAVETANGQPEPQSPSGSESDSARSGKDDIPGIVMIRERVDIFGHVRPLEPKEDIPALNIPPRSIGIIKEDPVKRWLTGQELWDKKFSRQATQVEHKRAQYVKKFEAMMHRARVQGLRLHSDGSGPSLYRPSSAGSGRSIMVTGHVVSDRRYGPFDVEDERPSPSAIVGRRDNRESIALLQKCIYFSAPNTHKNVPKRKTSDAVRAAFDPDDNPVKASKQSGSEQQKRANIIPMHGMRMWQSLLTFFMRKSSEQASKGRDHAASTLQRASDQVRMSSSGSGQSSN